MSPTGKSSSSSSGGAVTATTMTTTTTTTTTTTSTAGDTPAPTPSQPIRVLSAPHAQAARHAHTVLLLSLFAVRFPALVADPVPTMYGSLLPALAALQIAYAVLCLPPAGSQSAKPPRKPRPGEKKRSGSEVSGPNITVTILVALVFSAVGAGALHGLFVLLGAPFLTHAAHTFLCALHLALLGLFPLVYARGLGGEDWLEVLGARAPLDECFGGLLGACAGAWLGAVPIPLDWDRDWQRWPVTILAGVFAGYAVGKLVGGTLAFGKRLV